MAFPELSICEWWLAYLAAVCIGLSKTGFAGFGMASVVIMAWILPARQSIGVVLPMLIVADVFAVLIFRKHAEWQHVLRLLPAAIVGIIAGFLFIPLLSDAQFGLIIGSIVLIMVSVQAWRQFRPGMAASEVVNHTRIFAWVMGVFSGVTTMLANAAGPVMTVYLLACRLPKYEFVGTAAVFFMIVNWIKVPFSFSLGLITSESLQLNAALVPGIILGALCGHWLIRHVPQKLFEVLLLIFAAAASLRLILQNI